MNTCIYIYAYLYTYKYIHICIFLYVYININACINTCVHVYTSVNTYNYGIPSEKRGLAKRFPYQSKKRGLHLRQKSHSFLQKSPRSLQKEP